MSSAVNIDFSNGLGSLGNAWNVDTSVPGQVTLAGSSAMMEWAVGPSAGHGYGTYTVTAKLEGSQPGPGIILWPGDNQWPGQEIDMVEITPDGSGRQYGTVHWDNGGSDAYNAQIYDGVQGGVYHDYTMVWEPGKITFKVDGETKATVTDHVPTDYDHGGMNNTIGLMNTNPNTSITVDHISYTPLDGSTASTGGSATVAPAPAPAVAAVVADAAGGTASPSAADLLAADGPIDWNAIAAIVTANYHADGYWHL